MGETAAGSKLPPRQGRFRVALGLGLVILAVGASSAGMAYRGQLTFSPDQAVSALMALDIRDHGAHPVFYWGVEYAGTFEPHLLSLVFRTVSPSVLAYRLTMFLLLAAASILVATASRSAFGARAGLLAGLYLGFGPSFYFYKGLTSDGAYVSVLALLCASLAIAAWLAAEPPRSREKAGVAVLGACLGIAWWIHPLAAVMGPALGIPILLNARRWLRPTLIALFVAGFALGSAPWWERNLRNGFASLKVHEMDLATPANSLVQVEQLVERGVPILLGGRSAWGPAPTFPWAPALSVGFLTLVLAHGVFRLVRERERGPRFLLFASLAVVVFSAVQALAMARTGLAEDVRYLLPAYMGVASLTGSLLDRLLSNKRTISTVALVGVALALGPGSQLTAPRFADNAIHGRLDENRRLAADLVAAGHREVYASYWVAPRLMFLSEGKVTASSFGEGNDGVERGERFRQAVDDSANPGFLLRDDQARRLEAYLLSCGARFSTRGFPDLGLSLITNVPAEQLAVLRRFRRIPDPN